MSIPSAESPSSSLQERLFATAEDLVQQGLHPHATESSLFQFLTADPSKIPDPLKAGRVRVFQRAIGLPGPLCRDEASRAADAVGRALRWPPDRDFERRILLARLLSNLVQAAHDGAEDLRRDELTVTPENLKSALIFAVVNARPRSSLVPWNLPDSIVEKTIPVAIEYFFAA